MSFKLLKSRLARLEPKEKAEYFFGSIHINDPHIFHKEDHRFMGSYRVYGHIKGISCCFNGGYFDSFEEGMELLKNALRVYSVKPCKIFILETKDKELELNTIYQFEGIEIKDLYPQGLNEPTPDIPLGGGDFGHMTDIEWVAFFEQDF